MRPGAAVPEGARNGPKTAPQVSAGTAGTGMGPGWIAEGRAAPRWVRLLASGPAGAFCSVLQHPAASLVALSAGAAWHAIFVCSSVSAGRVGAPCALLDGPAFRRGSAGRAAARRSCARGCE